MGTDRVREQKRLPGQQVSAGWLAPCVLCGWLLVAGCSREQPAAPPAAAPAGPAKAPAGPPAAVPAAATVENHIAPAVAEEPANAVPINISHLIPSLNPAGLSADSPRNVVMLKTHEVDASIQGTSILQRELVRQAFLLAAREELGLATRDASLRETFPQEAEPAFLPFDILVVVAPGQPVRLTVFRQKGPEYEILLEKALNLDAEVAFEDLVAQCEAMSRQEFAEFLKTQGLEKSPAPQPPAAQPAAEIEAASTEINVIAQFAELRRLHAALNAAGDSPELLGALARGYALLGTETAFLWSPAHKVFEARGLLYAERLMQKTSASPQALWSRAFVRGLVGRHRAALDDLAAAQKAKSPVQPKPTPPHWVDLIRAHCEFDLAGLKEAEKDERLRPLARYLQMLEQEFSTGYRSRLNTARNLLEVSPESFRAMDLAGGDSPVEVQRKTRQQALELFPKSLYQRLENVPDLPEEASKICRAERHPGKKHDTQDEMQARVDLIGLLNRVSRTSSDRVEPSLGILAGFIQEISFVHGLAIVQLVPAGPGASAHSAINYVWPLIEGHPYQKYIESLRNDNTGPARVLWQLAVTIDTSELELTEGPMLTALGNTSRTSGESTFHSLASFRCDPVYRDLARLAVQKDNDHLPHHIAELLAASPHAPVIAAAEITVARSQKDPQRVLEQVADWEKRYNSDPTVLAALAGLYIELERDDDALRIANREVEVAPELGPYQRLAGLYKKRGDIERWKSTLDEYLKQDPDGLDHSPVQIEIANHFMSEKKWDQALPYAKVAAETGSYLGLMAAHHCYDRMKDWKNAELSIRRCAEHYADYALEWFLWCKRTGKGDAAGAGQWARLRFAALGDPLPPDWLPFLATFQQLSGDSKAALKTWTDGFDKNSDPSLGLNAALTAHDLGEAAVRDNLLGQIAERGRTYQVENRARDELIGFAALLQKQIAAGKDTPFDENRFAELVQAAPPTEPTNLWYFAGKFLLREGQTEAGRKYLMQAATAPSQRLSRTLAAALLLEQKIEIGEVRDTE